MPTINSLFSASNVGAIEAKGLEEYQRRLASIERDLDPDGRGMRNTLSRAAGMAHRHVMGLSAESPAPRSGMLPVDTGRLKNSIFWEVKGRGNDAYGRVATNLAYAPYQEDRQGFMQRTADDVRKPINDLYAAYVRKVANR